MKLERQVGEIMTKNVMFVHYNNSLQEVEKLMLSKNIRHIPVLKEGKLCGIVSQTDLQRLNFTKKMGDLDDNDFLYNSLKIEDIMMNKPITVMPQDSIERVLDILIHEDFHALPVVDNEVLVGIITTTDLMKLLLQESQLEVS